MLSHEGGVDRRPWVFSMAAVVKKPLDKCFQEKQQLEVGETQQVHCREEWGCLPSLCTSSSGRSLRDLTPHLCKEKVRVFTAVRTQLENHVWSTWDGTLDRCLLLLLRAHRTHTPKQHVYIGKENKGGPGVTYDMTEEVILIWLWFRQGEFGVPYSNQLFSICKTVIVLKASKKTAK